MIRATVGTVILSTMDWWHIPWYWTWPLLWLLSWSVSNRQPTTERNRQRTTVEVDTQTGELTPPRQRRRRGQSRNQTEESDSQEG